MLKKVTNFAYFWFCFTYILYVNNKHTVKKYRAWVKVYEIIFIAFYGLFNINK